MRICISWRCFSIFPIVNRVLLLIIDQRGRQNFSNVRNNMLLFKTKDYTKGPFELVTAWPADRYTFSIDIYDVLLSFGLPVNGISISWAARIPPIQILAVGNWSWQSKDDARAGRRYIASTDLCPSISILTTKHFVRAY
jgi:hypothetical protein